MNRKTFVAALVLIASAGSALADDNVREQQAPRAGERRVPRVAQRSRDPDRRRQRRRLARRADPAVAASVLAGQPVNAQ